MYLMMEIIITEFTILLMQEKCTYIKPFKMKKKHKNISRNLLRKFIEKTLRVVPNVLKY
jgi:hypothetical protein